ncbi:MAG: adenylate/guanylate cyclase domain-containing protein [Albidovulum sp.]
MADENVERRLAAVLAADVVGYSRLMESNEERTIAALKYHRREFFDPTLAKHGGRIFKVMGDGFLVEFASVLNAMRCAVEIQHGMTGRNAGVPEDRHIKFRIGINVGDLVVDGDDFYGDGVNMAARLEGLAPPGGISCSEVVRTQIGSKLELEFLDQGEKTVKNIAQPVHVYFINMSLTSAATFQRSGTSTHTPIAERPSVAVLPFSNMSNDPEQEFFSDGITEDIITDLSKVSGLSFWVAIRCLSTRASRSISCRQPVSWECRICSKARCARQGRSCGSTPS